MLFVMERGLICNSNQSLIITLKRQCNTYVEREKNLNIGMTF